MPETVWGTAAQGSRIPGIWWVRPRQACLGGDSSHPSVLSVLARQNMGPSVHRNPTENAPRPPRQTASRTTEDEKRERGEKRKPHQKVLGPLRLPWIFSQEGGYRELGARRTNVTFRNRTGALVLTGKEYCTLGRSEFHYATHRRNAIYSDECLRDTATRRDRRIVRERRGRAAEDAEGRERDVWGREEPPRAPGGANAGR